MTSPTPGAVTVYILAASGAPSNDLLALVTNVLNSDTVRPISDQVTVLAGSAKPYAIQANLTILASAASETVLAAAQAAVQALAADRQARLGRDVTPAQVEAALYVPGVYDVALVSPSSALTVAESEWAQCTGITLAIAGTANG